MRDLTAEDAARLLSALLRVRDAAAAAKSTIDGTSIADGNPSVLPAVCAILAEAVDAIAAAGGGPEPATARTPLTDRQASILAYIAGYRDRNGYAPSVREIGAAHGIRSPSGVAAQLRALRKKGYVRWKTTLARSLTPIP
jgi:hypothetical protein